MPEDQPHTRTRYPAGDAPPDPAPGRRPLRTLALVLAAVVALLVVVAVVNRTSGSSTPSGAAAGGSTSSNGGGSGGSGSGSGSGSGANASATAPTGTNPVTTSQDGIATGFPDTSEGAQSAAVNYSVALGSSEMYATDSRHAIVATVADPADQSALDGQMDPSYTSLAARLGLQNGAGPAGQTFVSRTVPVGTKVDSYSDDHATVEVWSTGMIGLAGTGSTNPVTQYWFTVTIQLHWTDGDWKVTSFSQKDGPTPVSGSQAASSANDIANAVNQFGGFRYAR
ncbi:hypothetical protein [Streptacidiphilus albus]|uniref:hypothetical protein n=1 Tax=Streptacidiphilus albus TaxID=105425 RepID=UPI001E49A582|nr:hypothetical protein [Streptacidiphilus albus]